MGMRSKWIEELDETLLGEEVRLAGWIKAVRKMGAITFFELRERTGVLQLRADAAKVPDARNEYCVSATGVLRKKEVPNPKVEKGDLELEVTHMEILSKAEPAPFPVREETEALEDTRLQYRYLDLRRHALLRNLEIRARICSIARDYFEKNRFLEVETPILNLATPEGARDYLVPSRTRKGCFYALPQSPQLFKQLLMVGGVDRYYQIARCFRDEDLRADRQPEFTQIDVEMSFMGQEEVLSVCEGLFKRLHEEILGEDLPLPLRRIPYWEALDRYGSDKPDTRYGLELQDLSFLLGKGLPGMEEGFARGIIVPSSLGQISRKKAEELGELYYVYVVDDDDRLKGVFPLKKMITHPSASKIKHVMRKDPVSVKTDTPIDDVAIIIDSTRRVADTIFLHMRYVNASPHGDLYGQPYRLERLDNGEWVDVHTDDIFTLEGHMFPPHSTSTVVRRIVNLPLPAGTYRVSVNFDYDAPSSPFRTRIDRPTSAVFYLP